LRTDMRGLSRPLGRNFFHRLRSLSAYGGVSAGSELRQMPGTGSVRVKEKVCVCLCVSDKPAVWRGVCAHGALLSGPDIEWTLRIEVRGAAGFREL